MCGSWQNRAMFREKSVRFTNRSHAGRQLARLLIHLSTEPVVVLGLPRGGVPVGFEVARRLSSPLEVLLVRKLGVPFQPELAMGAIGEGGVKVLDEERIRHLGIGADRVAQVERRERRRLLHQAELFRRDRPPLSLTGRTAVIVDDGIATGSTALAACPVARRQGAERIVMATPVAPRDAGAIFEGVADEFVAVSTPRRFVAIGFFYDDFDQTPDEDVIELLERSRRWRS